MATQTPPRTLPQIVRGNGAAAIGDSITQMDGQNSTGLAGSKSWFVQACMASGQRIRFVRNAGVSGERTDEMLARLATDVIAYRPDFCFILGGTNDIGQSVAQATIRANLTSICRQLIAARIAPILCTITPRSIITGSVEVEKLNAWIRSYAGRSGLWVADLAAATTDPLTFGWKSGYDVDGLHPDWPGSLAMATRAIADTDGLFLNAAPVLDMFGTVTTPTANMLRSGTFQVDTNADGVSDNWTLGGSAVGATISRLADASIFGYWQKLISASAVTRTFAQSVAAGSLWAVGDRIAFGGRFTTSGIVSGGMVVHAGVLFAGGSSSPYPNQLYPLFSFAQDVTDWMFYGEAIIPTGTTQLDVQLVGTALGTGTMQFAQVTLVNLTQMGFS